ncbi:hypothetical protein MPER_14258, partial [Moniliophthora perniciosa FA553]
MTTLELPYAADAEDSLSFENLEGLRLQYERESFQSTCNSADQIQLRMGT